MVDLLLLVAQQRICGIVGGRHAAASAVKTAIDST